jgi:hypothetical protein
MNNRIDYSQYGLEPIQPDYKSYGLENIPQESAAQNIVKQVESQQATSPKPYKEVPTFLGPLPDPNDPYVKQYFQTMPPQEEQQRAASLVLPFAAPEAAALPLVSRAANYLSKFPIAGSAANMLGRIGYGAAINTAPNALSQEGRQNIGPEFIKNAILNSILEIPTLPYRIARGTSEIFNPKTYTKNLSKQIQTESKAAEQKVNDLYEPVNTKYGDIDVTSSPESYMKGLGIDKSKLYSDAKLNYEDFIRSPTYKNLHDLQSTLGKDWARISKSP